MLRVKTVWKNINPASENGMRENVTTPSEIKYFELILVILKVV